jgi:CRP-like cAMP-binding protein
LRLPDFLAVGESSIPLQLLTGTMIPVDTCEPFFEYMRKSIELDSDMMELIAAHITESTFPPKHIILKQGDVCNKIFFVVSGMARSYFIDVSGMTVTWSFYFNDKKSITRNLFALDGRAYLTNEPSSIAIEALDELTVLVFTRGTLNFLMERSLKYEIWMRKLTENAYVGMYDRAFTLLTMSATERYNKLLNEEPHLIQMFSNHYIASYLGIAPQSLSRIKGQH